MEASNQQINSQNDTSRKHGGCLYYSLRGNKIQISLNFLTFVSIPAMVVVAAIAAFINAIFSMISLQPKCVLTGIITTIVAFLVIVFELPICCNVKCITPVHRFGHDRKAWQKAIFYGGIGIASIIVFPAFLCLSSAAIIGAVFITVVGILYAILAIGKKSVFEHKKNTNFKHFDWFFFKQGQYSFR